MTEKSGDFWFGSIPVDTLCLYRIGFGMLLFVESILRLPYSTELFSSEGFHHGFFSHLAPSPLIAVLLCLLLTVSSALVMVGLFTRYALVLTLILWTFLFGIDQINEKAVSSIAIVVMSILAFFPCGAKYSWDARCRARRGLAPLPASACALPLRLIQLEFAQVYFFSGLVKMLNPEWVHGTVMVKILCGHWATDFGVWLSGKLPDLCYRIACLNTIIFEILAGFLLFIPWARRWVILIGILYHLAIQTTLIVGFLGPHFILALALLYWDPNDIRAICEKFIPQAKLTPVSANVRQI